MILLIFNPKLVKKGNDEKTLPWQIYIDKSLSIKFHKQPSAVSYKNGLRTLKKSKQNIAFEAYLVQELTLFRKCRN